MMITALCCRSRPTIDLKHPFSPFPRSALPREKSWLRLVFRLGRDGALEESQSRWRMLYLRLLLRTRRREIEIDGQDIARISGACMSSLRACFYKRSAARGGRSTMNSPCIDP